MRKTALYIALASAACIVSAPANASFVKYKACVIAASKLGDWLDRSLAGLDCALDLSKEIKDSIPRLGYMMPTLDPNGLYGAVPGSEISSNFLLLNPSLNYVFGSETDYNTLLMNNIFSGSSSVSQIEVVSIPISSFSIFVDAADLAEKNGDLSVAFQAPEWSSSGATLFSGKPEDLNFTVPMTRGDYILRVASTQQDGSVVYGLSALSVDEPPNLALMSLGLLGFALRLRRGRSQP